MLACLAALIFLEVGLRAVGLGNPVLYVVDKGEAEGGYGYIPAPDQDVRRLFAENKINDFSMRSREYQPDKAPAHRADPIHRRFSHLRYDLHRPNKDIHLSSRAKPRSAIETKGRDT